MNNALVIVYSHAEYYPPTLNAIEVLSSAYDNVIVLQRNTKVSSFVFEKNVLNYKTGEYISIKDSQTKSYWWKLKSFLNFSLSLFNLIKTYNPKLILIYDPIPLLSFRLVSFFIRVTSKIWYHNHDLLTKNNVSLFSISWFAMINELNYTLKVDVFTLPSELRAKYFSSINISILPNYPSKKLITSISQSSVNSNNENIRIIYQGAISEGHGIEEIILATSTLTNIEFSIVGYSDENYMKFIKDLIIDKKLEDRVQIHSFFNDYRDLLAFTSKHHVGIGMYKHNNEMNITMGTASNKIFEYIACGLVVILNDTPFYKELFKSNNCIVYAELDNNSIVNSLKYIINNKNALLKDAKQAFDNDFYFEKKFLPTLNSINGNI